MGNENEEMSRADHLAWCKKRALEYVDRGDWVQAVASMGSDLDKHPETADMPALPFLIMTVTNVRSARRFVEGFH